MVTNRLLAADDGAARRRLALLLTFNGGYVDTAGFLALQGLFTAHVTGNFVTIGASLVFGTSGSLTKLLALPVFCIVVVLTRLAALRLSERRALPNLLRVHILLLAVGATLVMTILPGHLGDHWQAMLTGSILVAAMAMQNGLHRTHLAALPPSTLMTGTTTQMMNDLGDLLQGTSAGAAKAAHDRLAQMAPQVLIFAAGCGLAALLFKFAGGGCFVPPVLVALGALALSFGLVNHPAEKRT